MVAPVTGEEAAEMKRCAHRAWVHLTMPSWMARSDIEILWCKTCGATKLTSTSPKSVLQRGRWKRPEIAKNPRKFVMWCDICHTTYEDRDSCHCME